MCHKAGAPEIPHQQGGLQHALSEALVVPFFLSLAQAVLRDYHRQVSLRNKHLFLTVLEVGNPRSRPWQTWCLVRAYYLACKWLSSSCFFTWERGFGVRERRSSFLSLFVRALIPFMRTVPSPHEIITSQMLHLHIPAQ